MSRRKTPKDYRVLAVEHGFEWIGPDVPNNATRTKWRCGESHEWWAAYKNIRKGWGCPVCSGNARKTAGDYHTLATKRGVEWLGPEVSNNRTKTGWRCGNGHEWRAVYSSIQQGTGCPICATDAPLTTKDYRGMATGRGFEWLGPKVPNTGAKTKWRCGEGHEWWAIYTSIQRGTGCPVCAGVAPKTPEDYHTLALRRGFEWLGPKVSKVVTKTEWRCSRGHEWLAAYCHIQRGNGCPKCNESKGETAVASALDTLSIRYSRQARFRKCRNEKSNMLPFDFSFAFQGTRILVEYDGRQHFEPAGFFGGDEAFETRQLHDRIKDGFAAKYGFTLIRIPYTVENVQTHLIHAVADACGIEFGDVLALSKQTETAVRSHIPDAQPPTGIQMPLM